MKLTSSTIIKSGENHDVEIYKWNFNFFFRFKVNFTRWRSRDRVAIKWQSDLISCDNCNEGDNLSVFKRNLFLILFLIFSRVLLSRFSAKSVGRISGDRMSRAEVIDNLHLILCCSELLSWRLLALLTFGRFLVSSLCYSKSGRFASLANGWMQNQLSYTMPHTNACGTTSQTTVKVVQEKPHDHEHGFSKRNKDARFKILHVPWVVLSGHKLYAKCTKRILILFHFLTDDVQLLQLLQQHSRFIESVGNFVHLRIKS